MNTIIERITEAIKDILIGLIKSCLDNMFTSVNEQVGTIAGQVGQTPQGWNAGIFNLIQNISQTVIVPIAGLIITFVLCYELITMVTQKNNFHEFETYNIFLWIFKAYVAIYLVTNTFNITMAVFDVGQHVVNNAAGVISGNTAVDAKLLKELAEETDGNFTFQYSPESFQGTEVDYALEVCNAVLEIWQPTADNKAIINLPTTVENAMPHVFASQVEYFNKHLRDRENVILSLHPHNDRGSGVSDAELGILAGADKIEGTLFGNGERTGNVDIITLAMNMFSQGVNPELDFSNMSDICEVYERVTRMKVSPRQPYAGDLVFTAFSGSHQDAIAKGMTWRDEHDCQTWTVPYLPIDPQDVGRRYDSDVIRINSQSGKGGVNYILKQSFGISLPEKMREEVGYLVKDVSDKAHEELTPDNVYHIFEDHYINAKPIFSVDECHFKQEDGIVAEATIHHNGSNRKITGVGNGRLDAVSNAIKHYFDIEFELAFYEEHSLTKGSSSRAVAYVGVISNKKRYWGVGVDADIIKASIEALVVAVNKLDSVQRSQTCKDERLLDITNYIYANYKEVTLDDLAEKFFLSKPYLSKYIKEKSGMTFGDILKEIRMKKARAMLKSSSATVESIAESVGYQNVEHFNRTFKKLYNITPVQYRNKP